MESIAVSMCEGYCRSMVHVWHHPGRFVRCIPVKTNLWCYRHGLAATLSCALSSQPPAPRQGIQQKGESRWSNYSGFRLLQSDSELLTMLKRLGPWLSARDIAAAFYRLGQFAHPPQRQSLEFLTEKANRIAPAMSAYDVASVLKGCARMRWMEVSLFSRLCERLRQRECLLQMNGFLLSDSIISMGILHQDPRARWTRGDVVKATEKPSPFIFDTAQELAKWMLNNETMQSIRPGAFSRIVQGFGMMRFQSPALLKEIGQEVVKGPRLLCLRCNELAHVWRGLAQMQMRDQDVLLVVTEEISRAERLRGFTPWELETMITASRDLLPFRHWPFLEKLIQEIVKPDRLAGFGQAQLVGIIDALNVLRIRNDDVTGALLKEVTKRNRLPFFTQKGVASILCAMKSLGYGSHPEVLKLLPQAEKIIQERSLSDKQVLSFVFGKRKSEAEEKICNSMVDQLLTPERLADLTDEALSGLLAGLYERGITDRSQTDHCKEEIMRRLHNATPQVLSYYAYGLRVNRINSFDILQAFAHEVTTKERLERFAAGELGGIIYSLGVLGWKETTTIELLMAALADKVLQMSEQGLSNVVMAISLMQLKFDGNVETILRESTQRYRLLQATERCLVSLVVSFGKIRLLERRFTMPVMEEVTKLGRLSRLTNQELSDVIYNLAQTRIKTARTISNLKAEILKPTRLPAMHSSELARLIFGLGGIALQEADVKKIIADFIATSVDLTSFDNNAMTNVVRGLGGLRCREKACLKKLLPEAVKAERMESYTTGQFTSLVYGIGRMIGVDRVTIETLIDECEKSERVAALTDQQLTHVFVGMTYLLPQREIKRFPDALLQEATREKRLSSFQSFQLSNIASVLGSETFEGEIDTFAHALLAEISKEKRMESMTESDLTLVSRFLSRSGCDDQKALKQISDELIERFFRKKEKRDISTI